jgi:hypothetical protein
LLQVFYVDQDITGGPNFSNMPNGATVLINFTGVSRTWDVWGTSWNGSSIGAEREKILMNFYEPITVTLGVSSNSPIEASVLAPRGDSTVIARADHNGRLLAGGDVDHTFSEFHNFPFTGELPACDWGDHPHTPYPTVADAPIQAASHVLTQGLYLGNCVDGEPNGQPTTPADGDDTNGSGSNPGETLGSCTVAGDDEDGVMSNGNWSDGTNGGSVIVDVVATGAGACLNAWIDWTDAADTPNTPDGVFNNSADYIIQNLKVTSGAGQIIDFDVPTGTFDGSGSDRSYHTRYRLTRVDADGQCTNAEAYGGAATPGGAADSGEVEDYIFQFTPTAVTLNQQSAELAPNIWLWIALLGGVIALMLAAGWRFARRPR